MGQTKGYKHHPQLQRFKSCPDPSAAIDQYLAAVFQEASNRNYKFDKSKFVSSNSILRLHVTSGQLSYERNHLLNKLKLRDPVKYVALKTTPIFDPHPIFNIIDGDIEPWEIIS